MAEFPFVNRNEAAGVFFIQTQHRIISGGKIWRQKGVINFKIPLFDMFKAEIEAAAMVDITPDKNIFSIVKSE